MLTQSAGALPLLPLRTGVLFPGVAITLPVGRRRSVALVESLREGDSLVIGVQRDRNQDDPVLADLHPVATLARVLAITKVQRNRYRLVVRGESRVTLTEMVSAEPYVRVQVSRPPEIIENALEARALAESLLDKIRELGPAVSASLQQSLQGLDPSEDPGRVADLVTASLGLPTEQEVEVLATLEVNARLRVAHRILAQAQVFSELRSKIQREVQEELTKGQREALLRQQLKAIQKELGDGDGEEEETLRDKLLAAGIPEDAWKQVERELNRLEGMPKEQPEASVTRRYLEFIADLPWSKRAEVHTDLDAVAAKLDGDHTGLDEVKKRILEHLAVRKMTGEKEGAILCLVGPPGVGKTSLGQSIADATGRPMVRVSLGGVRDEADIRGHRRTYIGALPGRILSAIQKAGVKNPLLLLDEVDKLGQGWMGSPEAALLEVLDPEQNHTFTDHYLDLPFDLSEVFFICTANTLETLSAPLRDRLEVISLDGYTVDEKIEIARKHLWPKALEKHGLHPDSVVLEPETLESIVTDYTREAGVRQLNRELRKLCRAAALEVARAPEGQALVVQVNGPWVAKVLGKTRVFNEVAERTSTVGVATGLAWTPMGGEILFVESSRMPGTGRVELTGQLGDVMKESARAALTYIRSHADMLEVEPSFLEKQDIHVHVPAGAIPKDGPSAGVAIVTALASLVTGRLARSDTAMTGECTLRGRVLPVGGIKAKVLAAHRAGLKRVILPKKNSRDLDEVPESVRSELEFILVDDLQDALRAALEPSSRTDSSVSGARGAGSHPMPA